MPDRRARRRRCASMALYDIVRGIETSLKSARERTVDFYGRGAFLVGPPSGPTWPAALAY